MVNPSHSSLFRSPFAVEGVVAHAICSSSLSSDSSSASWGSSSARASDSVSGYPDGCACDEDLLHVTCVQSKLEVGFFGYDNDHDDEDEG